MRVISLGMSESRAMVTVGAGRELETHERRRLVGFARKELSL